MLFDHLARSRGAGGRKRARTQRTPSRGAFVDEEACAEGISTQKDNGEKGSDEKDLTEEGSSQEVSSKKTIREEGAGEQETLQEVLAGKDLG